MSTGTTRLTPQPCHACGITTDHPVRVGEVHAASGPGRTLYACPAHTPRVPAVQTPAAALADALRRSRDFGTGV
ncbi:hypothetical protein QCN29_24120 [Streptomyces sp. HNM0663]|uniref:Uncharacterized protein n=1 Tax=Streptomyces chengmaiensis TaxID=3040919 RepID=A0ABT6HSW4_9ACTN|nr:hypothetical protein [Streptomyces chengmaiensis]MDH2391807.1 hypothetical protein [Streptomyces chengmaiensis]